jgi:hypothetical protein
MTQVQDAQRLLKLLLQTPSLSTERIADPHLMLKIKGITHLCYHHLNSADQVMHTLVERDVDEQLMNVLKELFSSLSGQIVALLSCADGEVSRTRRPFTRVGEHAVQVIVGFLNATELTITAQLSKIFYRCSTRQLWSSVCFPSSITFPVSVHRRVLLQGVGIV